MKQAAIVLLTVATELSELAKSNLPTLRERETVQREWFENATFYRETDLDGQRFIAQFNFPQRESRMALMKGGNVND